jgi:deazaflavin-dependent oxidoreductase (nitroreductase family)
MEDGGKGQMTEDGKKKVSVPPRWFVRLAWSIHRGLYRFSGGRFGLRRAKTNRWGTMHLLTTGRRTGEQRSVILGYIDDGPNLVTLAMNGWATSEPAWWLNLQAHPGASVNLADGRRTVTAREAAGDERDRLWSRWSEVDPNLDGYAALRAGETAVVILETSANQANDGVA